MQYTTNLNLKKPGSSDAALISDINDNMDTLDTALSQLSGGADIYTNLSASSWVADSTISGYSYKCDIAITGVTASDVAEVVFAHAQAISGDYAPVSETYSGGVTIYSRVNTSITIPTIVINKG